jgi:hypothetical protein
MGHSSTESVPKNYFSGSERKKKNKGLQKEKKEREKKKEKGGKRKYNCLKSKE